MILRTGVQGSNETADKFCCRCVALKKKVLNMAASENMTFDEENLSVTFFRTLYTGLRQNNIRNELRHVLREGTLADEDLLVEVSLASAIEEERAKKTGGNSQKVAVNKLTYESDSDESSEKSFSASSDNFSSASEPSQKGSKKGGKNNAKSAKNAARKGADNAQNNQSSDTLAMVNKMAAAVEKLSTANVQLTAEVNALKQIAAKNHTAGPRSVPSAPQNNGNVLVANHGTPTLNPTAPMFAAGRSPSAPPFPGPTLRRNRTNRPIYLCQTCLATGSPYCRHCFKCGLDSHKVTDCPEN